MNQWMYDTIVATINAGVPVLANDLVKGLKKLVEGYQAKVKEIEELKEKIENLKATRACTVGCVDCDVEPGEQCQRIVQNKKTK